MCRSTRSTKNMEFQALPPPVRGTGKKKAPAPSPDTTESASEATLIQPSTPTQPPPGPLSNNLDATSTQPTLSKPRPHPCAKKQYSSSSTPRDEDNQFISNHASWGRELHEKYGANEGKVNLPDPATLNLPNPLVPELELDGANVDLTAAIFSPPPEGQPYNTPDPKEPTFNVPTPHASHASSLDGTPNAQFDDHTPYSSRAPCPTQEQSQFIDDETAAAQEAADERRCSQGRPVTPTIEERNQEDKIDMFQEIQGVVKPAGSRKGKQRTRSTETDGYTSGPLPQAVIDAALALQAKYHEEIALNLDHADAVIFQSGKITHFNTHYDGYRVSFVLHSNTMGEGWVCDLNGWHKQLAVFDSTKTKSLVDTGTSTKT
ncbi:hypothetical protein DXG01_016911 [Tephrocybe rancida]|nr:hypothetical protein DXG01_016911 [Tephrocybe rancida]